MYSDSTVKNYLNELASKKPIPGGGSASALVGAIGASLISKVANFTIGKEKYKNVEKEMKTILGHSEKLRESFNKLCSKDAEAYKKLSDVFKSPKTKERKNKIQDALKEAMTVPLEVCKNAHECMKLCMPLAERGNTNLITDVGDAALMLTCAFQSALLNVEINLRSIEDKEFVLGTTKVLGPMEEEINYSNQEVAKKVGGGLG